MSAGKIFNKTLTPSDLDLGVECGPEIYEVYEGADYATLTRHANKAVSPRNAGATATFSIEERRFKAELMHGYIRLDPAPAGIR